jgi:UDP:flavonoid glycosyltransferase YjiC (YdhE family)
MEVNVLATTGSDLHPAELGPQPSHIAMSRFVPQALVLRHVDAVVCHCGSGTMLGALAEGRPIVALPMAADQFANAEQIVRTGAGLAVPPEARTPEAIREAIEQVLDTLGFAQAAYALQAEIAAMPSAEQRAAELAERAGVLVA